MILGQQSPTLLAPGTSFVEDNFLLGQRVSGDGFEKIQGHCIYCALYFYCYISSISNHQAFDPRGWGPCFIRSMFCKDFLLVCGLCFHFLWQCPLKYKRLKFWWSPAYLRSLSKVTEICAYIFFQEFYNFDLDLSSWAIVSDCYAWCERSSFSFFIWMHGCPSTLCW